MSVSLSDRSGASSSAVRPVASTPSTPAPARPSPTGTGASPVRVRRTRRRLLVLTVAALTCIAAVALSLALGSRHIPLDQVWHLLWHPDGSAESTVLHEQRIPRTAVAGVVGLALALAGCLMQAMTRNPLAEPGILGVSAGASLAVVTFVATTGASGLSGYVWAALLGAGLATVVVQVLAGTGQPGSSPARLALAGVAVSAALAAITQTVILADQHAFNEFRFWVAGSVQGRGWDVLVDVAPFMVIGGVLAVFLVPGLNALGLGEDTARALGARPGRTRLGAVCAVTLLAGAATAAVGPIAFVGLAVPMIARWAVGHDLRWVVGLCLLLGPAWMLLADATARVLVPAEVPAGVVAALVGAPVFIAVVSRRKVPSL